MHNTTLKLRMNVRMKLCKGLADTYQADVYNYFLCARHHAWCWGHAGDKKGLSLASGGRRVPLVNIITIEHCASWWFQR